MARRIRWQIVIAVLSSLLVVSLLGGLALSHTTTSVPLAGGQYTEVLPAAPQQLNPLLNDPLTDPAGRDMAALIFDGLTAIGADGYPVGALAERWSLDPTGEVYTFRLRQGVTWHDGEPFDADDVIFTLRAVQDEQFGGDAAQANLWRNVLVDRIDDHTVRCTLDAPYAPFLAMATLPILPEHLLGDVPLAAWEDAEFARQPVGTGPFKLTELAPDQALLEAHHAYFAAEPMIERVVLRFVDAPQAGAAVLLRGDAHAMGAPAIGLPELNEVALPDNLQRFRLPLDSAVMLTFNLREAPLDNRIVRRALARGLDKEALIAETLADAVVRLDTPILPGWWAHDDSVTWHAYDPEAAAQLFDQLGYPLNDEGIRVDEEEEEPLLLPLITDEDPARLAVAEAIVSQWAAIGVQVEIEALDRATLRERLQDHDFVLALHGWARLGSDPDVYELWHSSQADDGLNYAGLEDDTIDTLLTSGRTQPDPEQRKQDYGAFQSRWVELVPGIMLYQPRYTFVASEEVGGMPFVPAGSTDQRSSDSQVLLVGHEDRYRTIHTWFASRTRELQPTLR